MSSLDPSTLWSLSATMFVMCIIVVVKEIKTESSRLLSTLLTLLGSIFALVALSISDKIWFDYILIVIFSIGIIIDVFRILFMLSDK